MIEKTIYDTAIGDGMPPNMANLLVAQSKHETAGYTSNAFVLNNNLFGYKYVKDAKWQIGAGITSTEYDAYAKYAKIEDSVHELTAWIRRRQNENKFPLDLAILDAVHYATLLKSCGYYGDPMKNYIAGLEHFAGDYSA